MRSICIYISLLLTTYLSAQIDAGLLEAIKDDDLEWVQEEIQDGADVNARDEKGIPVLIYACFYPYESSLPIVKLLVKNGAKIEGETGIYYNCETYNNTLIPSWYGSPIAIAAGKGNLDLLKYLVEQQGISVDTQDKNTQDKKFTNWTPLMHAAQNEQAKIIDYLLANGADTTLKNATGNRAKDLTTNLVLQRVIALKDRALLKKQITIEDDLHRAFDIFYTSPNYEESMKHAFRAEKLGSQIYGKHHPRFGTLLKDIARLYRNYGKYDQAIQYILYSLKVLENSVGIEDTEYVFVSIILASIYEFMGDFSKSIPIYEKAVEHVKQNFDITHPEYFLFSKRLADGYTQNQQYEEALTIYLHLLQVIEENPEFEEERQLANEGISVAYQKLGDYEKALFYLSEIISVFEEEEVYELEYLSMMQHLGELYILTGELDRALKILPSNADRLEEHYGKNHFQYAKCLSTLGTLYHLLDKEKEAIRVYNELIENLSYNIKNPLAQLPPNIQLVWKRQFEVYRDQLHSYLMGKPLPEKFYEFTAQFKGMTIRNYNALYKDDEKYQQWINLHSKIAKELSRPKEDQHPSLEEWERNVLVLESDMQSQNNIQLEHSISIKSLKNHLSDDEIVIDFVHFKYYDSLQTDSVYYVAQIIDPLKEEIEQVILFEEQKLGSVVNNSMKRRSDYISYLYYKDDGKVDNVDTYEETSNRGIILEDADDGVVVEGANLYDLIWEPLMPYLEGKTIIHYSPSGYLNQFNHNAVPLTSDSTLIDKFDLRQYTNMQSLVLPEKEYTNFNYALAGGIDYDATADMEENSTIDFDSLYNNLSTSKHRGNPFQKWNYLQWTEEEVHKIDAMFKQTGKWKGAVLSGENVTEENIKRRRSVQNKDMRVTHIASHGFFFPEREEEDNSDLPYFMRSKDPMLRSGLVFSGANHVWSGKSLPPGKEDGILTAYEIQHLNLTNTELVVLSACETGLGEIQGSEGVFGLQRAFKLAGVQYLIMSLWQVPDKPTQKLMTAFYKYWLLEKLDLRAAFRQAQKDMKEIYEEPYYWAGFVLVE